MKISNSNPPPTKTHRGTDSCAPILFLWLALQCLALLAAVTRIPFFAGYPQPAEHLAIELMLVVQITASSLLFTLLLSTPRATLLIIATTWPFLQLAGILSAIPAPQILLAALYLSLWLTTLHLACLSLRTRYSQMIALTLALLLSLGGPILFYIQAEFSHPPVPLHWPRHGTLGPLMGTLAQLHQPHLSLLPWIPPLIILFFASALAFYTHFYSPNPAPGSERSDDPDILPPSY